jgi:hypothetical protein
VKTNICRVRSKADEALPQSFSKTSIDSPLTVLCFETFHVRLESEE